MPLFNNGLYGTIEWYKTSEVLALLGIKLHVLRAYRRRGMITAYEPTPYMRANMNLPPRTVVYKAEEVESLKKMMEEPIALRPS